MRDVRAWAGIPYHMRRSLEDESHTIFDISPLRDRWAPVFRARKLLTRVLLRQDYHRDREPLVLESYARQVAERLQGEDVDVVLSPSTIPIARLRRGPIAFWTDAVFAGLVDYYPGFSNLTRGTRVAGDRMERDALERASLAMYSSDWAAEMAVEYYGADPRKVYVVPYGANVDEPLAAEDVGAVVDARPSKRCELLFVGVQWLRKGGDVAVDVARRLNDAGLETRLTIVGSGAADRPPPFVRPLGFVSKAASEGRALMRRLFSDAHFLTLPTRADCSPIVLCEANAFAVPTLTTRTGGIPTIVTDGRNGYSFAPEAGAAAYSDTILELFGDYTRYRALARDAHHEYRTRLNWETAGARVKALLAPLRAA